MERAFINKFKSFGFISFNYDQCPFVSTQIWFGEVAECGIINELRRKVIKNFKDQKIIIVAANEAQFKKPKRRLKKFNTINWSTIEGEYVDPSIAWESYFENINWLTKLGNKVVLIRSIPNPKIDGRGWLSNNIHLVKDLSFPNIFNDSVPSEIVKLDNKRYPKFDQEKVIIIDPANSLCDLIQDRCLDVKENYGPLYNGSRHQSYLGTALIAESVKKINFKWLG